MSPGSTLFPQLHFTESYIFSCFKVEVERGICIKIKRGPFFDKINYFSYYWCWSYFKKGTPHSTTYLAPRKRILLRVVG